MRKEDGDNFRKVKNFPKVTAKPISAKGRMAHWIFMPTFTSREKAGISAYLALQKDIPRFSLPLR